MGADLYIQKEYDENWAKWHPDFDQAVEIRDQLPRGSIDREAAQKQVEYYMQKLNSVGYFRDSYNDSSLLWTLGLSWWEDINKRFMNKQGYITPEKARELIALIDPLPFIKLPTPSDDWTRPQIEKYFTEKKERFLAFLRHAIETNQDIAASV